MIFYKSVPNPAVQAQWEAASKRCEGEGRKPTPGQLLLQEHKQVSSRRQLRTVDYKCQTQNLKSDHKVAKHSGNLVNKGMKKILFQQSLLHTMKRKQQKEGLL